MKNTKRFQRRLAAVAVGLALAAPGAALAAVDYFLKIDGIEGEATAKGHEKEIEVLSWSFGASRDAAAKKPTPCVSNIAFMKVFDKASPLLLANAVSGLVIPNAVLVARKSGEGIQEFLKVELKNVIITSVQDSASSEIPTESVSFSFNSMRVEYKPQKPDGSLGDPVQVTVPGGC